MDFSPINVSSFLSRAIELGDGHASFALTSPHEGFQQCRNMRRQTPRPFDAG